VKRLVGFIRKDRTPDMVVILHDGKLHSVHQRLLRGVTGKAAEDYTPSERLQLASGVLSSPSLFECEGTLCNRCLAASAARICFNCEVDIEIGA